MTTTPSERDVETAKALSPCDDLNPPWRCPPDDQCRSCSRVQPIVKALATARADGAASGLREAASLLHEQTRHLGAVPSWLRDRIAELERRAEEEAGRG